MSALRLADSWIWDSWYAFDGDQHHAFYLRASRGLGDPDRRHLHPSVGHAVSPDLREWTVVADALAVSDGPAFDDGTTWTGSIVRDDDGVWWMFYTGTRRSEASAVQRVGVATSTDLVTWSKRGAPGVVEADPRWYELLDRSAWHDQAWRDPFVFRGPDGLWHMYLTARVHHGPPRGRGVVGHCTSPDLRQWTVHEPLTQPQSGFGQMEVVQVEVVDGVPTMIFSCMAAELDAEGLARYGTGGVFSVTGPSVLGPFDIRGAVRFEHDTLYAARLVQDRGHWYLMGFANLDGGEFVGELVDPIPVTARAGHGLVQLSATGPDDHADT